MPPNTDINVLLSRYLWGECTTEERAEAEAWIAERDEHRAVVASLRAALSVVEKVALPRLDLPTFERRLAHRLHDTTAHSAPDVPTRHRGWLGGVGVMTGALAGVMVAAVVTAILVSRGAVWTRSSGLDVATVAFRTPYVTGTGQKAAITLDDGTRVVLGPQSKLRLAADYGSRRIVSLVGEAQFDVARPGSSGLAAPFIVATRTGTARVLGTVFSVNDCSRARRTQVMVESGKVSVASVRNGGRAVTLAAGDAAEMSDSLVRPVAADSLEQFTAWSAGQLHFHQAPVTEVLAALTRWYGYQFRMTDSTLIQHSLTVVIDAESFKDALNTLKLLLNVDLAFSDKTVTLLPRSARAMQHPRRDPRNDVSTPYNEVGR